MSGHRDWYVYRAEDGHHYVVDLIDGRAVRHMPASLRDVAQAVLRGKVRD